MTQLERLERVHDKIEKAIDATFVAALPGSSPGKPSEVQRASLMMGRLVAAGDILRNGPDIAGLDRNVKALRDLSEQLYRDVSRAMADAVECAGSASGKPHSSELNQCLEKISRAAAVLRNDSVATPRPWLSRIGGALLGILVGGGGTYYFGLGEGQSTSPNLAPKPAAQGRSSTSVGVKTTHDATEQGSGIPQQVSPVRSSLSGDRED